MAIDRDAVQRVVDLLAASRAAEIEIEDEESLIRVARGAVAAPVPDETPAAVEPGEEAGTAPVEASATDEAGAEVQYVTAGLVGLFHRGRTPDDEPIVSVGDEVVAGQVIGTIEALRKLTDVVAPCEGVIDEVLVDDGESVQFGDRLFVIRPEE